MAENPPTSPLSETSLPDRARELRDLTRCPACLEPLSSLVCGSCGLDLGDPLAHELAAASTAAAEALERRAALLGRMRDAARRRAAVATPVPAPETPALETAAPGAPAPAAPAPATAVPAPPAVAPAPVQPPSPARQAPVAPPAPPMPPVPAPAAAAPRAPRRSSVQVVLVIVGVSLLATFAVFGLVYAFINYGITVRSVIVGAVTAAAIAGSVILHRRGLTATGEGAAALGAFLVLLDAWAIRENDFGGLGSTNGALYWGVALLVCAVGFSLWGRAARMRVPAVAGYALLVPAAFVLVLGVLDSLEHADPASAVLGAGLAAIAVASLHRVLLPADRADSGGLVLAGRLLLVVTGLLAAPAAVVAAFFLAIDEPGADAVGALALLAIALVLAGLAVSLATVRDAARATRALAALPAAGAAATLVIAPLSIAARTESAEVALAAPLLLATATALLGELAIARAPRLPRPPLLAATVTALALGAIAAPAAVLAAGVPTAGQLALLGSPETTLATAADPADPAAVAALLALAGVVLLATGAWALGGLLARRRAVVVAAALLVAVLAAPFALVHGVVLGLWLLLAAAAVAVLALRRGRPEPLRIPLLVAATVAGLLAYAASWTTPAAWIPTSLVVLALLLVGRALLPAVPRVVPDVAALAVATVLAGALAAEYGAAETSALGVATAVAGASAGAIALAAALPGRLLAGLERRVLFWVASAIGAGAAILGAGIPWMRSPEPGGSLLLVATSGLLLLGWALWASLPRTAGLRPERVAATALLAPALASATGPLSDALRLGDAAPGLLAALAALLVAVLGLALSLAGRAFPRVAGDAGAAAVVLLGLPGFVVAGALDPWLALLAAALVALVAAISRDGLVESRSPRKQLGWVALALGVAALWARLGQLDVDAVEPYTLPAAGALLGVALLVQWRAPRRDAGTPPASVPYLVGAALLLALVPSALLVREAEPARTLVVGLAIAAVLATAAAAGAGSSRLGTRADRLVGYLVGTAGLVAALASVVARRPGDLDPVAIGAVAALAGVSLLVLLVPPAAGAAALSWSAFAAAALGALVLVAGGVADPLEWVSVPLAAALLARGALALRRDPATRSWAQLGAGLAVLLLPSLVAAYVDDPIWRVVGIGVVATAVLVLGLVLRLQAPFVLGAVVLGWHLVTQFWHQLALVYEAVPWWVWAGVAGALVFAIAIRYEQRLRNLRSVVRSVGQLR